MSAFLIVTFKNIRSIIPNDLFVIFAEVVTIIITADILGNRIVSSKGRGATSWEHQVRVTISVGLLFFELVEFSIKSQDARKGILAIFEAGIVA